jgi:hypothetical protein
MKINNSYYGNSLTFFLLALLKVLAQSSFYAGRLSD